MNISNALKHRMDFLAQRQGVVAGNVANVNTPRYAARDVDFKALTEKALGHTGMVATNPNHLGSTPAGAVSAGVITTQSHPVRLDGNAVVIEEEMLKMGSIRGDYALMNGVYAKYAQMYHTAISTGR